MAPFAHVSRATFQPRHSPKGALPVGCSPSFVTDMLTVVSYGAYASVILHLDRMCPRKSVLEASLKPLRSGHLKEAVESERSEAGGTPSGPLHWLGNNQTKTYGRGVCESKEVDRYSARHVNGNISTNSSI